MVRIRILVQQPKDTSMTIKLTRETEGLLQELMVSGRYPSQEEAIEEAVRLLAERDAEYKAVVAAVKEGVAAAESGDVYPLEEAFARIEAKYPFLKGAPCLTRSE